MNVITLHVLHSEPSNDFGDLRIAAPGLDRDARLAVWEGLPPPHMPDHPGIAPVVFQGDLHGHRAYAERMPRGLRLTDLRLPSTLLPAVALAVYRALAALHGSGQIHGHLTRDRVVLGDDGTVLIIGRGRRGGTSRLDIEDYLELFASLGLHLERETLEMELTAGDRSLDFEALATLVHERSDAHPAVLEQLVLHVGPSADDSLDEVVPYLGPEYNDEVGLLDRWAVTTSASDLEHTADLTDADMSTGGRGTLQLSVTLWTRLAAPREHAPSAERFAAMTGQPSRGVRALLAVEPQEGLPAMISGDVGTFLFSDRMGDTDTDPTFDPQDSMGSHSDDEDGDTAIYDLRRVELAAALHRSGELDAFATLEARVLEAERRIASAERRADDAEHRSRPDAAEPTSALAGFMRVEVFVGACLAGLLVWLVSQLVR